MHSWWAYKIPFSFFFFFLSYRLKTANLLNGSVNRFYNLTNKKMVITAYLLNVTSTKLVLVTRITAEEIFTCPVMIFLHHKSCGRTHSVMLSSIFYLSFIFLKSNAYMSYCPLERRRTKNLPISQERHKHSPGTVWEMITLSQIYFLLSSNLLVLMSPSLLQCYLTLVINLVSCFPVLSESWLAATVRYNVCRFVSLSFECLQLISHKAPARQ